MKTKTIDVYSDPGHAWGKVLCSELIDLGICQDISAFSYVHHGTDYRAKVYVYLEEVCDLGRYVEAQRSIGVTVKFRMHYSNRPSRIRGYYRFDGPSVKMQYDRAEALIKRQFGMIDALKSDGKLTIVKVGG